MAAREATVWTLFHYGITGWAMYALMGISLAYFAYRMNLPLSIRSALYPHLRQAHLRPARTRRGPRRRPRHDLRYRYFARDRRGLPQLRAEDPLRYSLKAWPRRSGSWCSPSVVATISAVSGVDRGIRRLSELNVLAHARAGRASSWLPARPSSC